MKFSRVWLQEWLKTDIAVEELVAQLTMAGLEVDEFTKVANDFNNVVVGQVSQCEKHPDADRLSVCQVDVGQAQTLQIVCGASNVRAGLRVAVAIDGAKLGEKFTIKKTKLRGVESNGMICSASELGINGNADGIIELADDAPIGQDIREYLHLDDHIIEVDLTPNRGDCLSMAGLAREVSVLRNTPYFELKIHEQAAKHREEFPIDLQAGDACPNYVGRIIKNVTLNAKTPIWMTERLQRSGIRSIDPIVDVTNYVMIELGQPMHAFDLSSLQQGIQVRLAEENEPLTLLDGQLIKLKPDCLVIADSKRVLALAGIMGGIDSAVNENTQDIFLESAFFSPQAIAGRSRRYGLHTDSSHRFERGVDPDLQIKALERATELLCSIVGGEPGPVSCVSLDVFIPKTKSITLRLSRVIRVLGYKVEIDFIKDTLTRLGMSVQVAGSDLKVVVPTYRFDIEIEVDLIEEIARVYGYNKLPTNLPISQLNMQAISEATLDVDYYRRILVDNGYHETISYSFTNPDALQALNPELETYALLNPISADLSHMRNSLLPGLLQILSYNQNRQQQRLQIFETGLCFVPLAGELLQEAMLAGLAMGSAHAETWSQSNREVDYYDVKAIIETLLHGLHKIVEYKISHHPAFHPGQAAEIVCDGESIGHVGSIHPRLTKEFDLRGSIVMFELKLSAMQQGNLPSFHPVSKFPTIRRDLSLVLKQEVTAQNIIDCIQASAGEVLYDIHIFDQYVGEGIASDQKSIALGIILQDFNRTLTDEEVSATITNIISRLEKSLGASLRT